MYIFSHNTDTNITLLKSSNDPLGRNLTNASHSCDFNKWMHPLKTHSWLLAQWIDCPAPFETENSLVTWKNLLLHAPAGYQLCRLWSSMRRIDCVSNRAVYGHSRLLRKGRQCFKYHHIFQQLFYWSGAEASPLPFVTSNLIEAERLNE